MKQSNNTKMLHNMWYTYISRSLLISFSLIWVIEEEIIEGEKAKRKEKTRRELVVSEGEMEKE